MLLVRRWQKGWGVFGLSAGNTVPTLEGESCIACKVFAPYTPLCPHFWWFYTYFCIGLFNGFYGDGLGGALVDP